MRFKVDEWLLNFTKAASMCAAVTTMYRRIYPFHADEANRTVIVRKVDIGVSGRIWLRLNVNVDDIEWPTFDICRWWDHFLESLVVRTDEFSRWP